jgi:hypothetical protein
MGEEVLAGTFFLNVRPIIILFDSGASHDFISSTCAKKAILSMVATEAPYVIGTPGGQVGADQIVCRALLDLPERVFETDLNCTKWSRARCYPRDELDEMAQGHTGHICLAGPSELTCVW